MSEKRVYTFGNGKAEGNAKMREELGGKGANLAEMNLIGVPVPPGFTITTSCCNEYYEVGQEKIKEILQDEVNAAVAHVEALMNSKFGDTENPLLVSVRSGARASMPGMMDTILNLGLNDEVAEGMVRKTNNPHFVYDSYRRFVQMYGDVVLFVALLQLLQDDVGFLGRSGFYHYLLEPSVQCPVLFDALVAFRQCGGAYALYLSSGQCGFQQVGGIHGTGCIACTHHVMDLVDENDDVWVALEFLQNAADALFKLAAVFCACHQGGQVEHHHTFVP